MVISRCFSRVHICFFLVGTDGDVGKNEGSPHPPPFLEGVWGIVGNVGLEISSGVGPPKQEKREKDSYALGYGCSNGRNSVAPSDPLRVDMCLKSREISKSS
jgi:hypothetical protein